MKKEIVFDKQKYQIILESFDELVNQCRLKYIGFVPAQSTDKRYMLVMTGSAKGIAVNACGTWATRDVQSTQEGTYYSFDTAHELYDWMAGR